MTRPEHDLRLTDDALVRLRRLWSSTHTRRMASAEPPVEMSSVLVVEACARAGPDGPTVGDIATYADVEASTASRLVERAVRAGLVTRSRSAADARQAVLQLTDSGRALQRQATAVRLDWLSRVLADWPADDVSTFATLLNRFADRVGDTGPWMPRPAADPHRPTADRDRHPARRRHHQYLYRTYIVSGEVAVPEDGLGGTGHMRAARFHRTGDPSVLQVDDIPAPRDPSGDEILVRVRASSVNGTDTGLRAGRGRIATIGRLPFIPGFDVAGEVLAAGPAVTAFGPGDRVVVLLGHGGGGQAERVLLRQSRAALAPRTVDADAAAALPLAGLTALQALHGAAALHRRPHARVLVNGASGGIGCFAVQLAKLAGARVTGVASGPKLGFVRDLGADDVVDHREQPTATLDSAFDAAFDAAFDVVLDVTGRLGLADARRLLGEGGVLVSARAIHPDALRARLRRHRSDPHVAGVMTRARSQDLTRLAALVDDGRLRIPVDRAFPLAEIAAAHRYAETEVRGKVVVTL